jgi:adenylate cyclase
MPIIRILPEDKLVESLAGETLLAAALRAGIAHAHACGGHARCSTCRVEIQVGIDDCSPRTSAEQALADRLGFDGVLRLACQTIPRGDITVRRLVLDDDDIELVDQRRRGASGTAVGEERELAILFSDIRGFTSFSESLPPHDVVHVLNRYFHAMGPPVTQFGGRIDNYMGDGLMALFGLHDGEDNVALRAVQAGLAMLDAMDALKPYLEMAYGRSFDMGVGIHYGEVVVGSVGAIGRERVTAIGDAVNFASRIEAANKIAKTRLLVSDAVRDQIGSAIANGRSFSLPIAGKSGEYQLHEVLRRGSAMNISLPTAIERYFHADASTDDKLVGQCFTEDAVVRDEGSTRQGPDAIMAWKQEAKAKYRYQLEPLAVSQEGNSVAVATRVSGEFPGSPIELTYAFVLDGDRIASLDIH